MPHYTSSARRPVDEHAAEAAVKLHAAGDLAAYLSELGTVYADERAELRSQIRVLVEQSETLLDRDTFVRALRIVS